jgi:hypothetical protein
MIDLYFRRCWLITDEPGIKITPRTPEATAWLSEKMWFSRRWDAPVQLDKPVTLSLDGANEIDALARADGLTTEGL